MHVLGVEPCLAESIHTLLKPVAKLDIDVRDLPHQLLLGFERGNKISTYILLGYLALRPLFHSLEHLFRQDEKSRNG